MQISTIGEQKSGGFRALIYGRPATGKTTFAVSGAFHPDLAKMALVNIDKGTDGITEQSRFSDTVVTINEVHNIYDLVEVLEEFRKDQTHIAAPLRGVKTIVIDSLTQLVEDVLTNVAGDKATKNQENLYGRLMAPREYRHYLTTMNALNYMVRELTNLGYNLIMLAQERVVDGIIQPDASPAITRSMVAKSSYVWRTGRNASGKIGIKVIQTGMEDEIKTRNDQFAQALKKHTNDSGWYLLPDATHQGLSDIYRLYQENK